MDKKSHSHSMSVAEIMNVCPLCRATYDERARRVLAGWGNTNLVHTTCARCQSAIMALVVTEKGGMSSVGMLTDMNYDDAVRFHAEDAVSIDDCLTLHQFLAAPYVWGDAVTKHYDVSINGNSTRKKRAVSARKR